MAGKQRIQRYIDQQPAARFGAATADVTEDLAPPAIPSLDTVEDLALDSFLQRSAGTPFALISATWSQPDGTEPQRYAVQWSTDSDFPSDNTGGFDAPYPSCSIENLKTNTLYYVRVAAVYRTIQGPWCDAVSITTENDTVPPSQPTSISWDWQADGDLLIRFTPASEDNYRDTEIRIWNDSGKGVLYTTGYAAPGFFVWPLAEQRRAQSNPSVLDAAVYIELRSRNWVEYYSSAVTPASQPSKAAPSAPAGLTSSWAGDTGTAGADCVISWTANTLIRRWVLTIDGVDRDVSGNKYTYTLDANTSEHSGTPDPTLSVSLVGYDALGQVSPSSSISPTNAAPAAPSSVTIAAGGPSNLVIDIGGTTSPDFRDYTVRILRDSSPVETLTTTEPFFMRSMTVPGTYQVGVKANDMFGQPSASETMSSAVVLDFITIERLRADTQYSDSAGTAAATLDGLKDGNTASTVVSYSTSSWSSILAQRPFLDRMRTITAVNGITGGSLQVYVGISKDNITWSWYAGPLTGTYSNVMTAVASEAAAQAAAFTPPATGRLELPAVAEARFVKLGVKGSTGGFLVQAREFYPRRLLQGDDLEIETIQAINIAADAITANKIAAGAILAAHISATAIDGKTITGSTIQTSASGARVVLSSDTNGGLVGYGGSDTYNVTSGAGTYQVLWKRTDGKLYAGAGVVVLDSSGIGITGDSFTFSLYNASPVTPVRANAIEWSVGSGTKPSITGSSSNGQLLARGQRITLAIPIDGTYSYGLNLQSNGAHALTAASFGVYADLGGAATAFEVTAGLFASGCSIRTAGGINAGTATTAGVGDVYGSGELTMTGQGTHIVQGDFRIENSASTARYLRLYNANGSNECLIRDGGGAGVSSFQVAPGGTISLVVEANLVRPNTAGTQNLGNATHYWNDVSYKTLTDRGCLALIDTWELPDGRKVSNTQALLELRPHVADKTIYGETKLDYRTVVKHSRKDAPVAEEDIYEDDPQDRDGQGRPKRKLKHKKGDRMGEDGVEMTALFSVMIGAIREQANEIAALQATVANLQSKILKH